MSDGKEGYFQTLPGRTKDAFFSNLKAGSHLQDIDEKQTTLRLEDERKGFIVTPCLGRRDGESYPWGLAKESESSQSRSHLSMSLIRNRYVS